MVTDNAKLNPLAHFLRMLTTSIGQKVIMSVTGIALIGFIIGHLLGNLELFMGRDAVNSYALFLHTSPKIIWGTRIGVLLCAVLHVWTSIRLALHNKTARPQGYLHKKSVAATFASRTMMYSGLVVLAFVIYHLAHFTWDIVHPEYAELTDAQGRHDVFTMMVLGFQNVYISAFYIVAQILLALHLSHGFISAPQTLGLSNKLLVHVIRKAGVCLAIVIAALFISIPVSVMCGFVVL